MGIKVGILVWMCLHIWQKRSLKEFGSPMSKFHWMFVCRREWKLGRIFSDCLLRLTFNVTLVEFRMKTWWSLLCRLSSFGDYLKTVLRWFLEFYYFYYINFNVQYAEAKMACLILEGQAIFASAYCTLKFI